jgi:molybdopterin-binding protein
MQLSARNQLAGRIVAVKLGTIMASVTVELRGGQRIVAAITREAAEELHLNEGDQVTAIIKSTEVVIGK